MRLPDATASWSAQVLSRFLGGVAEPESFGIAGGPLQITPKAVEDNRTPRRYRAYGEVVRRVGAHELLERLQNSNLSRPLALRHLDQGDPSSPEDG